MSTIDPQDRVRAWLETTIHPPSSRPVDNDGDERALLARKRRRLSHSAAGLARDEYEKHSQDPGYLTEPPPIPQHVLAALKAFSPGNFEAACIPLAPGTKRLLEISVPCEVFPNHAFLGISSEHEDSRSLELLRFAIDIHKTCTYNSSNALDKTAWYPSVRALLSVDPVSASLVPHHPLPYTKPVSPRSLFLTVDVTRRSNSKGVLPEHPDVKPDFLLGFNHKYKTCAPTVERAVKKSIKINPFADKSTDEMVVVLGVEVKSTEGGVELATEYPVGVWVMKMLEVTKLLASPPKNGPPLAKTCDIALSVSIYGHVWSMHLTYWHTATSQVTHGPVVVGSTDTLYGTLKIIKFVVEVKRWAKEKAWDDWKERIEMAVA